MARQHAAHGGYVHAGRPGSQERNEDHSHRHARNRRSGRDWVNSESRPAGRQHYRDIRHSTGATGKRLSRGCA
jgi:hypothetical protein